MSMRERIDVLMRGLNRRVLRRDFAEHALPQRVPLRHRIALVRHADLGEAAGLGDTRTRAG